MTEAVHHPDHYGGEANPYETIKVLEAIMTPEETVGFLKGNALKYLSRHRQKGGLQDLEKANWYSARLVDFVKRTGVNVGPQLGHPKPIRRPHVAEKSSPIPVAHN